MRIATVSELQRDELADEPVSRALAFFAERETALRARVDQAMDELVALDAKREAERVAAYCALLEASLPSLVAAIAEAVTKYQRKRGYLSGCVGIGSCERSSGGVEQGQEASDVDVGK
jgi:primosomal protein N''